MGDLSFLADACAEVEGSRAVCGLGAAVDFPWGANVDGRVIEVVPIPAIQPGSPAVVLPDLGLVFVGGDGGAAGVQVGAPEIVFVRADGSGQRLD